MAINNENQINSKITLNVEAEKLAFSDKIAPPNVYRDMAKPSEDIKIQPFSSEFSKPQSFNPFQFEKQFMGLDSNQKPIALESQPLKFDQSTNFNMMNSSSLMTGFENNDVKSITNLLTSQQLTNTSLTQTAGVNPAEVNKQVNKIINNTVAPAIENLSQHVMQMSHLDPDHKNIHDELPTIPPTNLVFVDRSASAMDKPTWA